MTAATLMNSGLMLTGLNLPDGQHADVGIRHGRFTDVRDARQGALEHPGHLKRPLARQAQAVREITASLQFINQYVKIMRSCHNCA